jgi:hypothetical protein
MTVGQISAGEAWISRQARAEFVNGSIVQKSALTPNF